MLFDILTKHHRNLGSHLRLDVIEGIKTIDPDASLCQELLHEAMELLLNIVSVKELQAYCDQSGITLSFLEGLHNFFIKNTQDRFGYDNAQSRKLLTHKLLAAVNDRKGIN
jgi:hypothetical protein